MKPILLDGKILSKKITNDLKEKILYAKEKFGRTPSLATILVGTDPASKVYVDQKNKMCDTIGIKPITRNLKENMKIEDIFGEIKKLNDDSTIDGILVQIPLPKQLRKYENKVMSLISPDKDVDGFNPYNIGLNSLGNESFSPNTPKGMIRLLEEYGIEIDGTEVVIVNRTPVIGKPLAMMFIKRHATVTVCHSHTKDLDFHLKRADIIAVGVGHLNFITPKRVKEGVVILDAGINRNNAGKIVGDVDFEAVKHKTKAITPVPGGIGPMTIAMLMENTYFSYIEHVKK
ncbi:MAG: bifunctional 5,10-methylenetetrahydrofolate dehydrogenase/5,10-methenyltetrahydrofolate cyclohydrolase [Promethearchaeota archaeon]